MEFGHGVQKNELGAGAMPSGKFGANAAWWRIKALVHNLLELVKIMTDDERHANARPTR